MSCLDKVHSTQTSAASLNEREFIQNMTKKQQEHVATARNNAMNDKSNALDDQRITDIKPLLTPAILLDELPLTQEAFKTIDMSRREVERIVQGQDDRMLVVVGPCSIHDPVAALDYACRLKSYADQSRSDLKIVMRVYFEKPRTTVSHSDIHI